MVIVYLPPFTIKIKPFMLVNIPFPIWLSETSILKFQKQITTALLYPGCDALHTLVCHLSWKFIGRSCRFSPENSENCEKSRVSKVTQSFQLELTLERLLVTNFTLSMSSSTSHIEAITDTSSSLAMASCCISCRNP